MRENVESFCCDAIVESFAGLLDYRSQGKEPVDEVQGKCAGLGTINKEDYELIPSGRSNCKYIIHPPIPDDIENMNGPEIIRYC